MALVWSNSQFIQTELNLNRVYKNAIDWSFDDDIYWQFDYFSSSAPGYRDVLTLWGDGYESAFSFCGPSITMNSSGAVTGGTVTGIIATYFDGDYEIPYFGIEFVSISAKSLYKAAQTSSNSDDQSLLNAALSGADEFILSFYDDSANGFGGNDTMYGNDGNDTLTGGAGNDYLEGGVGYNTFVFNAVTDTSNSATTCDLITDFWHDYDTLDLSAIDASTKISGNNSFVFKGTTAFGTSTSGEIYYKKFNNAGESNDYTLVYIDNDNDAASEAIIKLSGLVNLSAGDFLL